MAKTPTDLEILGTIYDYYYDTFTKYSKEDKTRSSKIYLPIDIAEMSKRLHVDPDIVFGRLYYHLNEKYGYDQKDGSKVYFFALKIGDDVHCVNFPYVASVLATLRDQNRKDKTATYIAIISLLISVIAITISLFK